MLRLKRVFVEKRGSYIVEAALIYPVIIVITTMLLLLMLFFFNSTQDLERLDNSVRKAAGEASETVILSSGQSRSSVVFSGWKKDIVTESDVEQTGRVIQRYSAQAERRGHFLSMIPIEAKSRGKAVWTSLNEDHIIRTTDLIFEKIGTE